MKASFIIVGALALGMTIPALAQGLAGSVHGEWNRNVPRHDTCLQIGRIWSWRAPNNRTLIVESDTHKKYKVDFMGYCPGLTYKETIAFRSIGGTDLSCVSPGDMVYFHDVGMESRCVIDKVSPYTSEPNGPAGEKPQAH